MGTSWGRSCGKDGRKVHSNVCLTVFLKQSNEKWGLPEGERYKSGEMGLDISNCHDARWISSTFRSLSWALNVELIPIMLKSIMHYDRK